MQELQAVDGGGHQQRAGVAVTGNRAGDVDQVHHRAAEDEPERVRVVRQSINVIVAVSSQLSAVSSRQDLRLSPRRSG
jgi:hypothetical protein